MTSTEGEQVLRLRVSGDWLRERGYPQPHINSIAYGEKLTINDVSISLHPAGHLLGSAQIRVERAGEVWVVSGDYKTEVDVTCTPFEPVRCHTFITESTFGLPIYRWQPQEKVFTTINEWWRSNQTEGRTSVLFSYALGKAQRILAGLDPSLGPILNHGAVQRINQAYIASGISLPTTQYADDDAGKAHRGKAIIIAPPSTANMPTYLRKFGSASFAFASGWMTIRGARRRRAVDRGFVLSDHADWSNLVETIRATGAEKVGVTHGYTAVMVRWLRENGWDAWSIETRFEGESQDGEIENEEPNEQSE